MSVSEVCQRWGLEIHFKGLFPWIAEFVFLYSFSIGTSDACAKQEQIELLSITFVNVFYIFGELLPFILVMSIFKCCPNLFSHQDVLRCIP